MASLVVHEARLHIEDIRRQKFSIGSLELNPLVEDLHHVVTSLSAELYTKDVHFLMELIQNAEDNKYIAGTEPTPEFLLIEKDITETSAPATLLVFNNEVGFSKMNMESLCGVGRSTKKGRRREGFIGKKGKKKMCEPLCYSSCLLCEHPQAPLPPWHFVFGSLGFYFVAAIRLKPTLPVQTRRRMVLLDCTLIQSTFGLKFCNVGLYWSIRTGVLNRS